MSGPARTLPAFDPAVPFHTLSAVRTPRRARWAARLLAVAFALAPVVLVFVPWQQTVRGRGAVVAFAPTERRQVVTARVGGQVGRWHVVEQQRVKAGDPLVDITDNDPDLAARLENQRRFLQGRLTAADEEVAEQRAVVAAQEKALAAAVGAAEANRDAAGQLVKVAEQARGIAEFGRLFRERNFRALDDLFRNKGLEPELSRDRAKMEADQAANDVLRADADIAGRTAAVRTQEALVVQADAAGRSAVALARSNLQRAEQGRFGVERERQQLDTQIAQFQARFVTAPCDGVVQTVSDKANQSGLHVKPGDALVEIVPDTTERVIELLVDGVDAPLVAAHMEQTGRGPHVRVQFEGWPAVQFAGWPSVAVGTFGGRVRQMDPTDDGYGRFRVLVGPDALFDGDTWPEGIYLRQGNQAVGWVFLNRVTVGYELWRQFNGFPPVIAPKPPDKDKGSKPPKIKV